MPQIQVLDFKPAPRLEPVGDKSSKQMKQGKHCDGGCADSSSHCQPRADGIFGTYRERAPDNLIRDRDACYGNVFIRRLRSLGIRDHPTSPRSPWQNGYAERLIGSIRRECLDHVVVIGERHLRHVLACYLEYYNAARTHLSLDKDTPIGRVVQSVGRIKCRPVLGGLHHQYARI